MFIWANQISASLRKSLLLSMSLALSSWVSAADGPLVVIEQARTANIIKQVPLTGTITSARASRLSSNVAGQVKTLHVEVGTFVEKDDVLLEIDDELEVFNLQAAKAATQQARAELTDAKRRFENGQRLRKLNSISANDIDLLEAEVEIDKANLQRAIAAERKQQALVERHRVKAPFAGVISERETELGEWIVPGTEIFSLVSTSDLRCEFRVPQEFFTLISDKSRMRISFDSLAGKKVEAKIGAVVPVSDPSARTFLVHVPIDNTKLNVTPGMSVHAMLLLDANKQGVVISRDALIRHPDGRVTVWIIGQKDNKTTVTEQNVEIGNSFDGKVSVLKGLKAGEKIVVQGNESLQNGQSVRIHSEN